MMGIPGTRAQPSPLLPWLAGESRVCRCHEDFLKLLYYCFCCDFISHAKYWWTSNTDWLMDEAKMAHAARTVQSEEAMRCPRTKVQCFQHHLAYNCPGHCVLSPELLELRSRMRHPLFYCALLLLHTIFICFEEKDLKSQSWLLKVSLGYWQTMEQNTDVFCWLALCWWSASMAGVKVWYFCGSIARGFLVLHSFIWSKEGVKWEHLGCHFRVEMTFLGDKSGWKAQEALVSTVICVQLLASTSST